MPRTRIGMITCARSGQSPLLDTLRSCTSADVTVRPIGLRVFSESLLKALPHWVTPDDYRPSSVANPLARVLSWCSEADVAISLEDDIAFADGWLERATAILARAEERFGPCVVSLHDMYTPGQLADAFVRTDVAASGIRLWRAQPYSWPNGSQGLVMTGQTARAMADLIAKRTHSTPGPDGKGRMWCFDVDVLDRCKDGLATFLVCDPCLLRHRSDVPNTWWPGRESDPQYRGANVTKRFCRFEHGPKVCLHMIVKNEQDVIARCLESVLPHVDAAVVVDTGSTDATMEIAAKCLQGKRHSLVRREWRGFAGSRNDGLAEARKLIGLDLDGWLLFTLDADEILRVDPGFKWPIDSLDGWHVGVDLGGIRFTRTILVNASTPWRYEGAVHEDVVLDREYAVAPPPEGIRVESTRDGARAKNPNRYAEDAELLLAEFERDPSPRTAFYIANSFRDSGDHAKAVEWYDKRASMSGFDQETWASVHERARCLALLGRPAEEVIAAHLLAYHNRPSRAETLRQLAAYLRQVGTPTLSQLFDSAADRIPMTNDILFVDRSAYASAPKVRISIVSSGGDQLSRTLTSAISTDDWVSSTSVRVFGVDAKLPVPSQLGNRADALMWLAGSDTVGVLLSDDVLCARGWLHRAMRLLEAAEADAPGPAMIALQHCCQTAPGDKVLDVGEDKLFSGGFQGRSKGLICRPATAMLLASDIEAGETQEPVARLLQSDPCLLWDGLGTKRFRPW